MFIIKPANVILGCTLRIEILWVDPSKEMQSVKFTLFLLYHIVTEIPKELHF